MATEHSKTLEALQTAIQMEIEGKKYYQKMSRTSGNELGGKLFQALAEEEDDHRRRFEEIYKAIEALKGWPEIDFKPGSRKDMKTLFFGAAERLKDRIKSTDSELKAVQKAMDMENKTYDFYMEQAGKASFEAEKRYYETLAGEERVHHLALEDYYEYMKNPAGYFTLKEHSSLDGG